MAMATRCPACGTLFRITPPQLQARAGAVRCGRCTSVFDGFGNLATLPEPAVEDTAVLAPVVAAPHATVVSDREPALPRRRAGIPDFEDAPVPPTTPSVPPAFRFYGASATPGAAIASHAVPAKPTAGRTEPRVEGVVNRPATLSADTHFLQQAHAGRKRGARGWTLGCLLLLLALGLQAVYFYRGELAAHYRSLKPVLVQMCAMLQCDVPLPQRPRLINIEASDLQNLDQARPGLLQLTATLRNHADHDLAYPALDLVLTNTREHTLARRIFMPREYLDTLHAAAGFPAKAEMTVRLELDTGDLGAAGFRLDLLPAATH
ncbi:MAG: DUF3426 domain-containing protein [Betaproteobacteria bacterium]